MVDLRLASIGTQQRWIGTERSSSSRITSSAALRRRRPEAIGLLAHPMASLTCMGSGPTKHTRVSTEGLTVSPRSSIRLRRCGPRERRRGEGKLPDRAGDHPGRPLRLHPVRTRPEPIGVCHQLGNLVDCRPARRAASPRHARGTTVRHHNRGRAHESEATDQMRLGHDG